MTSKLIFPRTEVQAIKVAPMFGGKIHGADSDGVLDIEFPTMIQAASFVRAVEWEKHSQIRSDGNGVTVNTFNKPVVIQVQLGE